MWRVTLLGNTLIMILLWLLSLVAITPAHSLLVQYRDFGTSLPILTDFAIMIRDLTIVIPASWALGTFWLGATLNKKTTNERAEMVSAHSSATLVIGLLLLLFYCLAGILPILKIGTSLG